MEVTHLSDYDTHAIMGGGNTKGFGILNTAEFITVLSSTLYSDAFLAVIREVVCNAWDAHKMVGKEAIPVDISIDQTQLVIRDYGPGIDPAKMVDIYCTYGNSTKKQQENQTGGFGLGSKSPFAYTNYFTVTVNYKGKKTIWAVSRGSADTGGMPDIRDIVTVDTEDEGVEVNIPLVDGQDAEKFTKVVRDVVRWGEINANLNGKLIEVKPMSQAKDGIYFTDENPPTVNGRLYVRYGNVIYPIPTHREYESLYEAATKLLERTSKTYNVKHKYESHSGWHGLNAFFEAGPNSLSITPSRESIHTSDRTINTVKAMLQKFVDACGNLGSPEYALNHELQVMDKIMAKMDSRAILMEENLIAYYYGNIASKREETRFTTMQGSFFTVEEVVIAMAARGFIFNDPVVLKQAREQRFNYILQHDKKDVELLMKLRKLLKQLPGLWEAELESWEYQRRGVYWDKNLIHYTGIAKRAAAAKLNPRNFIMWDRNGQTGRGVYAGKSLLHTYPDLKALTTLSRKVVMIVSAKGQIVNHKLKHTQSVPNWEKVPEEMCLVYHMPSNKRKWASHDEVIKFFQKMRYDIIDIVGFYEQVYPPKPKAARGTVVAGTKVKTFKRKTGAYPSISYLIDPATQIVDFNRAKHAFNNGMVMLEKFDMVFKGHNLTQKAYSPRFFPWGTSHEEFVVKEYGDRAVFVKTDADKQKLIREGATDGMTFLVRDVCNRLLNDAAFKASRENQGFWRRIWIGEDDYMVLKTKTKVGAIIPDVPMMSEDTFEFYELFQQWRYHQSWMNAELRTLWDKTDETIKSWRKDAPKKDLEVFFSDAKRDRTYLLEFQDIIQKFKTDTFKSPAEKAFCETLLIQALS